MPVIVRSAACRQPADVSLKLKSSILNLSGMMADADAQKNVSDKTPWKEPSSRLAGQQFPDIITSHECNDMTSVLESLTRFGPQIYSSTEKDRLKRRICLPLVGLD